MVERLKDLVSDGVFRNTHTNHRHFVEQPQREAGAFLVRHVRQVVVDQVHGGGEADLAFRQVATAGGFADLILTAGGFALLHILAEEGRVGRVERDAPALAAGEHHAHRLVADHCVDQGLLVGRGREVAQDCEDNGEGGEALLAIDHVGRALVLGTDHNDGAEEVNGVVPECVQQVLDQDFGFLVFPRIAALEGRDANIGRRAKNVANALDLSGDRHEPNFPTVLQAN